jgi:uncharacterized membrane protein
VSSPPCSIIYYSFFFVFFFFRTHLAPVSSPHFMLISYRGIFLLCFAYFHLRSRRSEDAGHVPLTTRFVYITYFLEMLAFQVIFCRFIICNNKSQLLLHPYMPSQLINLMFGVKFYALFGNFHLKFNLHFTL